MRTAARAAEVFDDTGRRVVLPARARRVVSLVPSLTEALFAMGAGETCVAATQFCVFPEAARAVPRVGGTKTPAVAEICALRPELVLVSVEENRRDDAEALLAAGVPVFATHPRTLPEIGSVIRRLGACVGREGAASRLADEVAAACADVERWIPGDPRPRTLVPVWKWPWIVPGERTFLADLVRRAGGRPILPTAPEAAGRDWPEMDDAAIAAAAPEVVLLPDEPYRFTERHAADWRAKIACPASESGRIHLVDGQLLTWAGPRIGEGLRLVARLLHPGRG